MALLKWWADMIAAGQFPGAPGGNSPQAAPTADSGGRRSRGARGSGSTAASDAPRGSFPVRAVALGVGAVVLAAGLAAVTVPRFLGGDEATAPTTVSSATTMPASVGDLVPVTGPGVGDAMEPLLGLGLRPLGITVTGAYGADPAGPLELAAMATSTTTAQDAAAQIAAWTARTGATVGDPVAGSGRAKGITCARVKKAKGTPAGALCIWTAGDLRGQTYVVGAKVAAARELTTDLRAAIAPDSATTDLVASS